MKISSTRYPIDLLLCLLWSIAILPIALFSMDPTIRTILGLPFLLFIPGYVLVFALFPKKKTDRGIDVIERIALSFGLSIAVIPLIGLLLNYTPWGIRLEPILLSLFFFIVGIGTFALYRWVRTEAVERFVVSLTLSFPSSSSKIDRALTIILSICIILAVIALVYVMMTPKTGETFTEFYLLGPSGKATGYPRNLSLGENATVIIGLANHEQKTMNYTVEVWLVDQSIVYNSTTLQNETVYHHLWFMDTQEVSLDHVAVDTEKPWTAQWQVNYTFSINRTGEFKLAFLVFTTPMSSYDSDVDYRDIAVQKIDSAYRALHLWISVQ